MSNPYASPVAKTQPVGALRRVPLGEVPTRSANVVERFVKPPRTWRLAAGIDELYLIPPDELSSGTAFAFTHQELVRHCKLLPMKLFVLSVRGLAGPKATAFQLVPDALAILRGWMAREHRLHIASALRRRLAYGLPISVLILLTSSGLLGGPADPFGIALGVLLFVVGVLSKAAPSSKIFLLDIAWWTLLVVDQIRFAIDGSRFAIFLGLFGLLFARGAVLQFRFFRSLEKEAERLSLRA